MAGQLVLIGGPANPPLAEASARALGAPLAACEVTRFPDGEIHVEVHESVRNADVYLLQPTTPPIESHLFQLLLLADACRRGGAERVTAVVPYFGYARQDRRASGREAVGARVVADMMGGVHIDRVVAVDLHTPALEGVFPMPLEQLTAVPRLAEALGPDAEREVVVAPDAGAIKLAERWARRLELPLAAVHKTRIGGGEVQTRGLAGEVRGCRPLVVDDMISTGGTIAGAIAAVLEAGAIPDVVVAVTHALFVGSAGERLRKLPIACTFVTDTVGAEPPPGLNVRTVSVAPLLADAVSRLHEGRSLGGVILHV